MRIPSTSKPGVPYIALGKDNSDILEEHHDLIVEATIERLRELSKIDCSGMGARELIQRGLVDALRIFIKGEPHALKKLLSKRWRLIMASSVVDQLVERVLCAAQNKKEISIWNTIPSTPGISLSDDEQLKLFHKRIMDLPGTVAEADVTGWDWSVKEWELLLEGEMRADLCNATPWLRRIFRNRELCCARAPLCLPDGTLLEKAVPGVMPSGRYNTSSSNSRLRVAVAMLCGAEWAVAMGDDCLEQYKPDAQALYEKLGHPLKMYNERDDEFEFCSQVFTRNCVYPADGTKTLYNLLEQKTLSPELLNQFKMEMRNHPRKGEFLASVFRAFSSSGGTVGEDDPRKQFDPVTRRETETS